MCVNALQRPHVVLTMAQPYGEIASKRLRPRGNNGNNLYRCVAAGWASWWVGRP